MDLLENERLDAVNDNLNLIQKTDGLTFGTDALLLAGYVDARSAHGAELGGGTGIISFLLATRGKISTGEIYEIQEEYSELIKRNTQLNSLCDRLRTFCMDVRDVKGEQSCDVVYSNPPYMKTESGKHNEAEKKNVARHEVFGGIDDFCSAAKRLLRYGGDFYVVYRPDRLPDLICAMRNSGIEPKRMTFVQADINTPASMVMIEGKRGGKSGMKLTAPLIIYSDSEHRRYTDDMSYIMENGKFPKAFTKAGK